MAVAVRSHDEIVAYRKRRDLWTGTHYPAIVAAVTAFATAKLVGPPTIARVFLRDMVGEFAGDIVHHALRAMILGIMEGTNLTAMAVNVGRAAGKACEKKPDNDGHAAQIGYAIVSVICDATGAAEILDKHADRPEKTENGVKITAAYELKYASGQFFEDAQKFGSLGMPTFSKNGSAPWVAQNNGGTADNAERGMVHSADRAMKGVTADSAPLVFQTVNILQAARFRVNPTVGAIVLAYDRAAAEAWLLAHYLAAGLSEAEATRKAREDAQL